MVTLETEIMGLPLFYGLSAVFAPVADEVPVKRWAGENEEEARIFAHFFAISQRRRFGRGALKCLGWAILRGDSKAEGREEWQDRRDVPNAGEECRCGTPSGRRGSRSRSAR